VPAFHDVLEREIRIAARPETIFAFFTDPVKLIRWKGMRATLDPQPGGLFRVDINGRDVARGEYLEITPPHRIVLTWGWEGENSPLPPGASTVEIALMPDGPTTIVRLRHSGLPSLPLYQLHMQGWDHYLPRLTLAAEGYDPGPDPKASPDFAHI
jgi:uncharacterized protein YndB with AHSA1/START domain